MFCHWRYVIDNLFGPVKAVSCQDCTAADAAYGTFELENGIISHFNSSWTVRVRRDDLLTIQVDGTQVCAVTGLRECVVQHDAFTPKPIWNPDSPNPIDFYHTWQSVAPNQPVDNAFKAQWEHFLTYVAADEPFPWTLLEGSKGVQLAELAMQSWQERRWLDVPPLEL
ncbi:MAG: hypothetical protein KDF65_01460 [Anaerolineae bacterium]|nr:hypothetical protein [Anaerolineae bacterium]